MSGGADNAQPYVSSLQNAESVRPVWERCGCDQWGRCLVDCPTAHLPWREQPIYRRIFGAQIDGPEDGA